MCNQRSGGGSVYWDVYGRDDLLCNHHAIKKETGKLICKHCGQDADKGSRGPATNYLRPICHDCAAEEDGSELETLIRQSVEMQTVFDNLFPSVVQELETVA